MRKIIVLILFFKLFTVANAQEILVEADVKRDNILIGVPDTLQFHIAVPPGFNVSTENMLRPMEEQFVLFDTLIPDTTLGESGRVHYYQGYVYTTFDTGRVVIPQLPVILKSKSYTDTVYTDSIPLQVSIMDVDTTKAIKNIKAPYEVEISYLRYYLWGGGILVLIIGIAFLIYYLYKKNKDKKPVKVAPEPQVDPADHALQQIKELEREELWQKGKNKEYYSRLSDILRMYMEIAFDYPATDRTTGQIVNDLYKKAWAKEQAIRKAESVLHLADMVKFAKQVPVAQENEQSIEQCVEFINETYTYLMRKKEDV